MGVCLCLSRCSGAKHLRLRECSYIPRLMITLHCCLYGPKSILYRRHGTILFILHIHAAPPMTPASPAPTHTPNNTRARPYPLSIYHPHRTLHLTFCFSRSCGRGGALHRVPMKMLDLLCCCGPVGGLIVLSLRGKRFLTPVLSVMPNPLACLVSVRACRSTLPFMRALQ